ncbi:MAG: MFS transporter [Alphaproteobacteria bacterium]
MPALILIVFIDLLGFGLIIPILPFYAEHFGASPGTVTLLMASYSLMQFIAAPIIGALSDQYGRRKVILVSLAGTCVAYVAMAYASTLVMLFVARALAGLFAGNIAAAQAYIADVTTPENRARGMGVFGAAFGFGFIFGPVIGGYLTEPVPGHINFHFAPLSAAGLSVLAAVLTILILKESRSVSVTSVRLRGWFSPILAAGRRADMKHLVFLFLLVMFVFAGLEATIAMWAERQFSWGPREVGRLFAYVGVVAAVVQGGLIGPATRRWGEARVVVLGLCGLVIGFAAMPLAQNMTVLLVATALLAGGFGLCNPALNSLISRRASSESQGAALGVAQSGASLARILGPAFAGAVFSTWGRHAPYMIGAVLLLFAIWIAWRMVRASESTKFPS